MDRRDIQIGKTVKAISRGVTFDFLLLHPQEKSKMSTRLIIYLVIITVISLGCTRKNSDNKTNAIISDSVYIHHEPVAEKQSPVFSPEELNQIMDSLNKSLDANRKILNNIVTFSVRDGYILMEVIDGSKEKLSEFRKEIIDSPAIRFEEIAPRKPDGKECNSCGFELFLPTATYKLPVDNITAVIKNNTDREAIAGVDFFIEYFDQGDWKAVSLNYFFIAIGYDVLPHESSEFVINLQPESHTYQPGLYRLYKTIISDEKYNLIAEFRLE